MWINVTTVGDLLDQRAERSHREALVMPEARMTYPHLSHASDVVAAGLMQLGIGHGDKVGILMPNCASYIETLFGAAKLGAITVPINARLKAPELRHIITHADIKALLVATDPAGADHTATLNAAFPDLHRQRAGALNLTAAPQLRTIVNLTRAASGCLDRSQFEARAATTDVARVKALQQRVRIRDVALLMYTSGTTSTPKGCLLTHEAVVRQAAAVAQTRLLLNEEDVMWNPLPLFHCGGIVPLLGVISVGAKYCHTGHFEAGHALEMIDGERCTVLYPAFEAIWRAVLDHPKFADYDLSTVRVVMNVATPRLLAEFEARMPWARQISSYGSTECATNLTIPRPDEPYDVRIATVGTPVAGMEIKIVDPSTGAELPVGRMGELCFRGYSQFEGYYKDPEHSAQSIDTQGWFHTGDRARIREDGCVEYGGRLKDMLKVGGENVAAAEIEDFLAQLPGVAVAQVVAAPDPRYQEVPAAFIECVPGTVLSESGVIESCRGQIASYKVPRYVRFVDDWPMSGTKIKKSELLARLAAELAAQHETSH